MHSVMLYVIIGHILFTFYNLNVNNVFFKPCITCITLHDLVYILVINQFSDVYRWAAYVAAFIKIKL